MSDFKKYFKIIKKFIGITPNLTIATNTLKFWIPENKHSYIWLDPPWIIFKLNKVITSSDNYPHHEGKNYDQDFQDWCVLVSQIRNKKIIDISGNENLLKIIFEDDFFIELDSTNELTEGEDWYAHWYASDEEK